MKNTVKLVSCIVVAFLIVSCITDPKNSGGSLESGFTSPADSMQTSVYWYWISDNISKEGVVKDLYSMKRPA